MAVMARLDHRDVFAAPVRVAPRHVVLWGSGVLLALGAWCGLVLLGRQSNAPVVRVAALQPGLRRGDARGTPDARDRAMLDRLTAQTRVAAGRGARLVVWPEAALAADPAIAYAQELADLARQSGASIVVGYGIQTPAGRRNEVVDPSGAFVGRYGKDHPVGFLGETSVWRGTYPTVEAPFGRMGTIICYDMDFTDTARELAPGPGDGRRSGEVGVQPRFRLGDWVGWLCAAAMAGRVLGRWRISIA
jgi:apolipoprotein N-acyltransferase